MATGAGRFAVGSQFTLVQRFFAPFLTSPPVPPGRYNKAQLGVIAGLDTFTWKMQQYNWEDDIDDYFDRVWVYNSMVFSISDKAEFIVEADGSKRIENFAVFPRRDVQENFDLVSDDGLTGIANIVVKPYVDPSGIGRIVNINFSESDLIPRTTYTSKDFANDLIRTSDWFVFSPDAIAKIALGKDDFVNGLFDEGVTKFLDGNKPIIYGTPGDDLNLNAAKINKANYPKLYGDKDNGVVLIGGTGADNITGGLYNDKLLGGQGADRLRGYIGSDILFGEEDNDTITGDLGDDTLYGEEGDDLLNGGYDDDILYGGLGNDTLYAIAGNDRLYGEDDNDLLRGGFDNDSLYGGAGEDSLYGEKGDDFLDGEDGNDTLAGSSGNDILFGGEGNDTLNGNNENDKLFGEKGDDVLNGEYHDDTLYGGLGKDTLYGGAGNDTLYGEDDNDFLKGGLDNDSLYGGAGNDTLYGEKGNDFLYGGDNNDTLYGGDNNDTLYGGFKKDTLFGDAGNDFLYGEEDNDFLYGGAGNDFLYGGIDNDNLYGDFGNDVLDGQNDNDVLDGKEGNDNLFGGTGNDILYGGAGNDLLIGVDAFDDNPGLGEIDSLTGGKGSDFFGLSSNKNIYYNGRGNSDYALITDFDSKTDKIQLKGSASDYTLAPSPTGLPTGTAIYHNSAKIDLFLLADASESFSDERSIFTELVQDLMNDLKSTNPSTYIGLGSFDDYPVSPFGLNRVSQEKEVEEQVIVGYRQEKQYYELGHGYYTYSINDIPIYETQIKKEPVEVDEGNAYVYKTHQLPTDNEDVVLSAINNLDIQTQADDPEAQLEALLQVAAVNSKFRHDSTRFVVLSTDAIFHQEGDESTQTFEISVDYTTISEVKTALKDANIMPIFAVTPNVIPTYQALVAQLGVGAVVSLSADSSSLVNTITENLTTQPTHQELIGIVQGTSKLDLNGNYFIYV